MSESNWAGLRHYFLASYDELRKWLTARLRSADVAADVLHDIYVRIERGGTLGPVRNPKAYIRRMARNIALNRKRHESRLLTSEETAIVFEQAIDEAPHPARIIAARQEVEQLHAVLHAMPERRRLIFLSAWVEEVPHPEIARRLGMSLRRVQKESQKARLQVYAAVRDKLGDFDPEGRLEPARVSSD